MPPPAKERQTTVQKRASLDEKTVQKVAKGEVQPTPRKRSRAPQRPRSTPVSTKQVHPDVWKTASMVLLTEGGYRSIEVVSETTVIVR
jgi:hypothetical protein